MAGARLHASPVASRARAVKSRLASLLHYRVRWKPVGTHPGASGGVQAGSGDQLRALVQLRDHPDPRRLDLRASLRDPLERLWVRDFHLNTALKLVVLMDMSASMGYVGRVDRMAVARDIAAHLALAAWKSGDAFGLYGANETPRRDAMLPPRVNRGAWLWVQKQLAQVKPHGASAAGMLKLVSQLPRKRALVCIVSDFRWPEGELERLLKNLAHHDVAPIVLQDPAEVDALPERGIAILRDAETGADRFVWMRPGLTRAVADARQRHLDAITRACRAAGRKPFLVRGEFDPLALTCHFLERAA